MGAGGHFGNSDAENPPSELIERRNSTNSPNADTGIWRILDAAENRAREGLRVVEDYVRFVLDDATLTEEVKSARHQLTAATRSLGLRSRLTTRDTQHDVGTDISTPQEISRSCTADVVVANLRRAEESLRSIEEYGKVIDPAMAAEAEQIRYAVYTLEKRIGLGAADGERMPTTRLYVLVDGGKSAEDFAMRLQALFNSGVRLVQLRDKRLDDRELVARGRALAKLTHEYGATWIMNDRADLAVICGADGVHVGQEELTVPDARRVVGPGRLVGVSTHSIEQARAAVADGADYIGVGPTFASGTKSFEKFTGVELLSAVATEITVPAYAIGGVSAENVETVLASGIQRVAVSGAVWGANDVGNAAAEMLQELTTGDD